MNTRLGTFVLDKGDTGLFRDQLIDFISGYSRFSILDTGATMDPQSSSFRLLAGWDEVSAFTLNSGTDSLIKLNDFLDLHRGKWIFGHINYELKNILEPKLHSHHEKISGFPVLSFFVPGATCLIKDESVTICIQDEGRDGLSPADIFQRIVHHSVAETGDGAAYLHSGRLEFCREAYLQSLHAIRQHLQRGDIYEINYCVPFNHRGNIHAPQLLWKRMQEEQQSPFGALYRDHENWLLCCSPERFIRKEGQTIISQPIKGTSRRGSNPEEDDRQRQELMNSDKERAENVMIVDLVRNDLGHIAQTGTVKVDELFGIYSYRHVHQMISTISAQLKQGTSFTSILQALFPMGSMTGAPKFRAMQIIEELEIFSRGLYSGSVGYISPDGDFDFNVVIRSILYDSSCGDIFFPAGSAITMGSDPEKEFEECLLKAEGMYHMLQPEKITTTDGRLHTGF